MKAYLKIKSFLFVKLLVLTLIFQFAALFVEANPKQKKKQFVLVIDPGHGGKDPGSIGKLTCEKDVVLRIALKLGKIIKQSHPDVKVIYTRETDVFIELNERAAIANRNKADLFISIHTNASKNKKPYGVETFLMGESKSDENLEVAKLENAVILKEDNYTSKYGGYDPNAPETFMIMSLIQSAYHYQSLSFANEIQMSFKKETHRFDRGIKQAGFLVLWKTAMPSVLIETGFISNVEEEKNILNSDKGCEGIAKSIYSAFRRYTGITNSDIAATLNKKTEFNSEIIEPEVDTANNSIVEPDTTVVVLPEFVDSTKNDVIEFCIQLVSTKIRTSTNASDFKGIKNVEEIIIESTYKYVVGKSTNYNDVADYSKTMKKLFPDAFVIAIRNNKIIPLNEALKEIKN